MDQYGSRFIQQKLETATVEAKTKIFTNIIPHARALMTDVFGNYVIQKVYILSSNELKKYSVILNLSPNSRIGYAVFGAWHRDPKKGVS